MASNNNWTLPFITLYYSPICRGQSWNLLKRHLNPFWNEQCVGLGNGANDSLGVWSKLWAPFGDYCRPFRGDPFNPVWIYRGALFLDGYYIGHPLWSPLWVGVW